MGGDLIYKIQDHWWIVEPLRSEPKYHSNHHDMPNRNINGLRVGISTIYKIFDHWWVRKPI